MPYASAVRLPQNSPRHFLIGQGELKKPLKLCEAVLRGLPSSVIADVVVFLRAGA